MLAAAESAAGRTFTDDEVAGLRAELLALHGRRLIELSTLPVVRSAVLPDRPRLSRFNRVLARRRALLEQVVEQSFIRSAC